MLAMICGPVTYACVYARSRSYYHNAATGIVTWEKPAGVDIVPPPAKPVIDAADTASSPSWLQRLGSDGLPDLPSPARPHNPSAPWHVRTMESLHYSLVYSRKVSLAVAAGFVVILAIASWREHQKQAAIDEARRQAAAAYDADHRKTEKQ
jgi:hypothetical protein